MQDSETPTTIPDPTEPVTVVKSPETAPEVTPEPKKEPKRQTFRGRIIPQNAPEGLKSAVRFAKNLGPTLAAIGTLVGILGGLIEGVAGLLDKVSQSTSADTREIPGSAPEFVKSLVRWTKHVGPSASVAGVLALSLGGILSGIGKVFESTAKLTQDDE